MPKVDVSAVFFAGVSILYPLVAAVAVRVVGPQWVVLGLFVLLGLRTVLGLRQKIPGGLTYGLLLVAIAVAVTALINRELSVRLYPAFMSAAMLLAFGYTLVRPPSMIERFARLLEPNMSESGVRYTRMVTWVWVGFFAVNGAIAVWTALYAPWSTWTLYNGLISYIAMGVLGGGELLLRPFVRRASGSAQ
jgi:uncharacterized membrane protein